MKLQQEVEYFDFEQDFMEDNIRCIPMIVRFKLDACGIKMKLKEWSKATLEEREQLAIRPIDSKSDLAVYKNYVQAIIYKYTGALATILPANPIYISSATTDFLPEELETKLEELKMNLSLLQWKNLSTLQRFALLKLTRPGHENRNFPRAMKEFGLA